MEKRADLSGTMVARPQPELLPDWEWARGEWCGRVVMSS
jgi:hypothetical protein